MLPNSTLVCKDDFQENCKDFSDKNYFVDQKVSKAGIVIAIFVETIPFEVL